MSSPRVTNLEPPVFRAAVHPSQRLPDAPLRLDFQKELDVATARCATKEATNVQCVFSWPTPSVIEAGESLGSAGVEYTREQGFGAVNRIFVAISEVALSM